MVLNNVSNNSVCWAAFMVGSGTEFKGSCELILKIDDLVTRLLPIEFLHPNLSFEHRNAICFHFESMTKPAAMVLCDILLSKVDRLFLIPERVNESIHC
jgi:hypothetical protein